MIRFAANLSFLYPDRPFLDRFAAAAADGFDAVEFLFPYAFGAHELAARLRDHGLRQVLFNVSPGDWDAGERGLAARPGHEARFRDAVHQALAYADVLGCRQLHVMAGLREGDPARQHATYTENLAWAAALAAPLGIDLLLEAINPRDMPGYLLSRQQDAHDAATAVGAPNVKVQMDLYHCQVVEGDLTMRLREHLPGGRVAHVQIAGVPSRQEPDEGELNLVHLLAEIEASGFAGHVGCEYRPRGDTSAGLAWLRRYRADAGS
ncbi:2-oxo-tetronate isomerase [Rhizobacter sp. Root1221]|uniref:2-oxo-tetronate isomerase n=1 Tax=Rhizobacter sp. Root1221 TaxID=1736433 RepID=UPI0006FC398F|nr:2-oxo-tetronate isomerase [Rhizobacter sp. Root1221]KQW02637.1 hydroxypyruvate isomerase [Rhizobacter sp. Root1221]